MSCYDLYIENCLKLCFQDDYIDRRKLRAHNRAMDTLEKLEAELTVHELRALLTHEDERVRLSAAAACLRRQLCYDEAVETLREIEAHSTDGTLGLAAKMLLKTKT